MKNKDFIISAFRTVRQRLLARRGDEDEDALQDAFCRLWIRRDDFSSQGEAEGFLTVAARNLIIDGQRKRQSHPEADMKEVDPHSVASDDDTDRKDLFIEVRRLIEENLSQRDAAILNRRDRDGWDFEEIAGYYGISEANARLIVSRSRKAIREIYRKRQKI